MRKRNYELWNRETDEIIKIKPKHMTRLYPCSNIPQFAAHLKLKEHIDYGCYRLKCIN